MKAIKRKKQSARTYELLRQVTQYLTRPNLRERLDNVLAINKELKFVTHKRIWLYFLKRPQIIKWVNEYINDKYIHYQPTEALKTAAFVCDQHRLTSNDLHYARTPEIDDTIEELRLQLTSGLELRNSSDFSTLQYLLNNVVKVKTLEEFIQEILQDVENCRSKCPLGQLQRPVVVLDGNIEYVGPVDVMFIGLNPGTEEAKQGKPFVGLTGIKLREFVENNLGHLKYIFTNCILCSTRNESEIPEIQKVITLCRQHVTKIVQTFQPKIIVLVGDKACSSFGITGKISQISGTLINDKYFPLIHPSAVSRNPHWKDLWERSLDNLLMVLGIEKKNKVEIKGGSTVTWDDVREMQLTLFDLKILEGQTAIYIFLDNEGKKYYLVEEPKHRIYIKRGELPFLALVEDEFDQYVDLTPREKHFLVAELRKRIAQI